MSVKTEDVVTSEQQADSLDDFDLDAPADTGPDENQQALLRELDPDGYSGETEQEPQAETDNSDAEQSDESSDEGEPKSEDTGEGKQQPGTSDKALQKLQQRQSALESQINERFDKLMERIEAQQSQPQTAQQEQATGDAAEAVADLQARLDGEDDDLPTRGEINKVLARIDKAFKSATKPGDNDELKTVKQQLEETRSQLQEVRSQSQLAAQAEQTRQTLAALSKQEGFDVSPMWDAAQAEARDELDFDPDAADDADRRSLKKLANKRFERMVQAKRDESKAEAEKGKKKKTTSKAGTAARQSTEGTDLMEPSGRTSTTAKQPDQTRGTAPFYVSVPGR